MNRKNGTKCSLSHCLKSQRTHPNIKIFKFPPAETEMGNIWRELCGFDSDKTNIFLCQDHFQAEDIGKKYLKRHSIPSLYLSMIVEESDVLTLNEIGKLESPYRIRRQSSSPMGVCSSCLKNIQNCEKYRSKCNSYGKKYNSLILKLRKAKQEINKLQRQVRKLKIISPKIKRNQVSNMIDNLEINKNSKTFAKMLVKSKNVRIQWDQEEKTVAQNIFYRSQSGYNFLREGLLLNLPHKASLYRWSPVKNLQPGIENTALQFLKNKVNEMNINCREAVLVFDEIAIRRELHYNEVLDLIDGVEDLGFQRNGAIGKQVCVFMVRGLIENWKSILNYFVTETNIKGASLNLLIHENLELCCKLGLNIRAIVCDQGSNNRNCFSQLGVTVENPYFIFREINVYCLFDFPHLIKSLRNVFIKSDIITPHGIVSFDVIRELWELEKFSVTKMCPKLTEKHIYPNDFDKMRVKYATQTFSKSVSAGVKTLTEMKKFKKNSFEIAQATSSFIKKIDTIFDCMNSGSLYDKNIYRQALKNDNNVFNYIKEFLTYFKKIRLKNKTKVYCLKGIQQTLNGTLQLSANLFSSNPDVNFLLTKRLNQDLVENLFSQVRAKGGNNRKPSLYEINFLLAKIISSNLFQFSKTSNCEEDNEPMLEINIQEEHTYEKVTNLVYADSDIDIQNMLREIDSNHYQIFEEEVISNLNIATELPSMRYFIGYVLFKVLSKINCVECSDLMRKKDEVLTCPSELLIFAKNYSENSDFGNLFAPSDLIFKICKLHILIFDHFFKTKKEIRFIKNIIIEHCILATEKENETWFKKEGSCYNHKIKILDFLILILIRKHCSWAIPKAARTKHPRLEVLIS